LFGPREQAHGGEHQVMEAEDVGDGTVDLGELAHDCRVSLQSRRGRRNWVGMLSASRPLSRRASRSAFGVPPRSSRSTAVRANSAAS
jgi:hypothetical protein